MATLVPSLPSLPFRTHAIGLPISLLECLMIMMPNLKSTWICSFTFDFKFSGSRYDLRRFGLKSFDKWISCWIKSQNRVFQNKHYGYLSSTASSFTLSSSESWDNDSMSIFWLDSNSVWSGFGVFKIPMSPQSWSSSWMMAQWLTFVFIWPA